MKKRDVMGQRFGRLVVIGAAPSDSRARARWLCLCDCGTEKTVGVGNLTSGKTQSCGCLMSEVNSKKATQRNLVHGHNLAEKQSPTWHSWRSMIKRCCSPGHNSFPRYGGRGITICDRWRNSFVEFLADMGERPPGKTLDRINVHGNYEPSNCRWATASEQQNNRADNRARK
jgi:hypothetical protein